MLSNHAKLRNEQENSHDLRVKTAYKIFNSRVTGIRYTRKGLGLLRFIAELLTK